MLRLGHAWWIRMLGWFSIGVVGVTFVSALRLGVAVGVGLLGDIEWEWKDFSENG